MSAQPFKLVPLSHGDRVHRTVSLCLHCLRNIAFYRAGFHGYKYRLRRQFWVALNGGFMDTAILEWCKLFSDRRGKHRWNRSVDDEAAFAQALYRCLGCTEAQFEAYIKTFRHPRNKFIAHLDDEDVMTLPRLRMARASAAFLHGYLVNGPSTSQYFSATEREPAQQFYAYWYRKAVAEYRRAAAGRP